MVLEGYCGQGTQSLAYIAAKPEDVAELLQRTTASLRAEAVALEERALAEGVDDRFGITVAFAPLEEEE